MVQNNLKKRHKRLAALAACFLLLCCMMVPVFAADTGTTSSRLLGSIVPFDRIAIKANSSSFVAAIPWAGNDFYNDGEGVNSVITVDSMYTYSMNFVSYDSGILTYSFSPTWNLSTYTMRLECDAMYVSKTELQNGSFVFGLPSGCSADYSVSFYINSVQYDGSAGDGSYRVATQQVTGSASGRSFDLAATMYRAINAGNYGNPTYYYITGLVVSISNVDMSGFQGGNTAITINTSSVGSRIQCPQLWLDSFNLQPMVYEPADPGDLEFGWLVGSVSQVLNIELWPGFSIAGVLRIIFIVGLLFWFLKLTF